MENRNWKVPGEAPITEEEMLARIQSAALHKDNLVVFVGTDSQTHGRFYNYITVVGLYTPGKGGTYFFTGDIEERKKFKGAQKLRMFEEVTKSLNVATLLFEKLDILPEVHLDVSPSHKKEFTSSLAEQLSGYVLSSGFEPKLKPDSWAASAIADRHARKGKMIWTDRSLTR